MSLGCSQDVGRGAAAAAAPGAPMVRLLVALAISSLRAWGRRRRRRKWQVGD